MRWIKKELAVFYVKACALFLKSFVAPALLFSSLIYVELVSVYGLRERSLLRNLPVPSTWLLLDPAPASEEVAPSP